MISCDLRPNSIGVNLSFHSYHTHICIRVHTVSIHVLSWLTRNPAAITPIYMNTCTQIQRYIAPKTVDQNTLFRFRSDLELLTSKTIPWFASDISVA